MTGPDHREVIASGSGVEPAVLARPRPAKGLVAAARRHAAAALALIVSASLAGAAVHRHWDRQEAGANASRVMVAAGIHYVAAHAEEVPAGHLAFLALRNAGADPVRLASLELTVAGFPHAVNPRSATNLGLPPGVREEVVVPLGRADCTVAVPLVPDQSRLTAVLAAPNGTRTELSWPLPVADLEVAFHEQCDPRPFSEIVEVFAFSRGSIGRHEGRPVLTTELDFHAATQPATVLDVAGSDLFGVEFADGDTSAIELPAGGRVVEPITITVSRCADRSRLGSGAALQDADFELSAAGRAAGSVRAESSFVYPSTAFYQGLLELYAASCS